MIGIPFGLIAANGVEWAFHKYVLHGLGKNPSSFFHYHLADHHKAARENAMRDANYRIPLWKWSPHTKEVLLLAAGAVAILPLLPVAPFFVASALYCNASYYRMHRRSHLDPAWGKKNMPWHYAHHMGNQNKNWCVTSPFFDKLMGTDAPMRGVYGKTAKAKNVVRTAPVNGELRASS